MAGSSSGLGRQAFFLEIGGSNPSPATILGGAFCET